MQQCLCCFKSCLNEKWHGRKTFNHAPSEIQLIEFPDFVGGESFFIPTFSVAAAPRLHLTSCGLFNLRVQRVARCVPNFGGLAGEWNVNFLQLCNLCGFTSDEYENRWMIGLRLPGPRMILIVYNSIYMFFMSAKKYMFYCIYLYTVPVGLNSSRILQICNLLVHWGF